MGHMQAQPPALHMTDAGGANLARVHGRQKHVPGCCDVRAENRVENQNVVRQ